MKAVPSLFAEPVLPTENGRGRRFAFIAMALGTLAVAALALALGQDANWDFRNYHWYNGYAVIAGRLGFDLLPAQTPSFYNPALDVPFYLMASHVTARTAAFILGLIQGLNFPLLFLIAQASLVIPNPRHKVLACATLAALGVLGGGGIALIGTTFYDNVTSLGLWVSVLVVLARGDAMFKETELVSKRLIQKGRVIPAKAGIQSHIKQTFVALWLWTPACAGVTQGWVKKAAFPAFFAGLPAGLAMGLKLPCVAFCVGLCGAFFFVKGPFSRRFFLSFVCGLGVLVGLAVSLGPWAVHLFKAYGNPIFPYFNDFFASPYAPAVDARDVKFLPHGIFDNLFFPFIFAADPLRVGEIPWRDFRLPLLYALLPLALALRMIFGRNKNAQDLVFRPYAARFLLGFAAVSYAVWLLLFAIYRYVIPLEMLAPLLLVFAGGMLPLKTSPRALVTGFLLIFVALTVVPGDWTRQRPWLAKAVEVDVPLIEDPSRVMILMMGYEPYSHVVPSFPPEIPFVRVQSNFTYFDEKTAFWPLIEDKVRKHQGLFKILMPEWDVEATDRTLAPLALKLVKKTCAAVRDRLYDSKLVLCDLKRTGKRP